jgi:hypothetical protein
VGTSDLDNPEGHNILSLPTPVTVHFLGRWATWGRPETLCSWPVSERGLEICLGVYTTFPQSWRLRKTKCHQGEDTWNPPHRAPSPSCNEAGATCHWHHSANGHFSAFRNTGGCEAELPTGLQESRWPHAFTKGQTQVPVQAQPHNVLQRNEGLPESASKGDCTPRQCRRGVHHCFFQSPAAAPQPQPKSHHFPTFWAIQLHPRLLQAGEHRASYLVIGTSCWLQPHLKMFVFLEISKTLS